jgi:putative transposase
MGLKNWKDAPNGKITYVNVKGKLNYICLILDLFNREIIGYATGKRKSASLLVFKN